MIPRYFQPMLLIDARLDREITGRIPSEFAFSSFEVAVHYVEPHQTHIKFLQPILNAFYITPLSYTQTRPDDFPAGSRGDSADGSLRRLDKPSPAGIQSAQVQFRL